MWERCHTNEKRNQSQKERCQTKEGQYKGKEGQYKIALERFILCLAHVFCSLPDTKGGYNTFLDDAFLYNIP